MKAVPTHRYVVFLTIAVVGCASDLATKRWVFHWLGMPGAGPSHWLWPDVFGFTTSLNTGALFGIGQGMVAWFAGLSLLAGGGIVYWLFVRGGANDWLLTIALGAIMAGICGNLYDRLGLPGLTWPLGAERAGEPVYAVRDWLHFKLIDFPIFNLADSLLVCGAVLLAWHALRMPSTGMPPAQPQPADM